MSCWSYEVTGLDGLSRGLTHETVRSFGLDSSPFALALVGLVVAVLVVEVTAVVCLLRPQMLYGGDDL